MDKESLAKALQHKIDTRTKPLGSLGQLEDLALQLGRIQNTLEPQIKKPRMLICAADHGLAAQGVSAYPQEVTLQMLENFLSGGAAINAFCKTNGLDLGIVNTGVKSNLKDHPLLRNTPIALGSKDCSLEPAMSKNEAKACLDLGKQLFEETMKEGSTVLGLGEMGIGNTAIASLVSAACTGLPVADLTGPGTGLLQEGLNRKKIILEKTLNFHKPFKGPEDILCKVGGFEIGVMAGAMIAAASSKLAVLVDGFICSSAALLALAFEPECRQNLIFCHCSAEPGHKLILKHMEAKALLDLGLRLGEGTGAALALPLLRNACAFLNEMASFESAGVSEKS